VQDVLGLDFDALGLSLDISPLYCTLKSPQAAWITEVSVTILIGQYDSLFVRRVAIAMRLYGIQFEHRPWSVFSDAAQVAAFNPLLRVPTLVLDDGEVLVESAAILDGLDDIVGDGRALMPASGQVRRHHLRICALAAGLGDKVVSLIYERAVHGRETPEWMERCHRQIATTLDALERDRTASASTYWFGEAISHADIVVTCVLTQMVDALGYDLDAARWPKLIAHRNLCEARAEFRDIYQPFIAPPPRV
jgi:glutathione S-transferase